MKFRSSQSVSILAGVVAAWVLITPVNLSAEERVFDVVAPFEIGGLDPAISGFVFQRMQITETLLEADAKGNPIPALAEKWGVSEDGKQWTFKIRQGVKFHNGSKLTADAVAHSLNVARNKTGMLRNAKIDSITVLGDDVVIKLAEAFKPLGALLAHSSTNILAPEAYDAKGNVQKIIGTGPYELTLLEPPQRLAAKRFEGYWGVKPSIEKTTYLGAGRGETRSLMAESGGAELVFQLDPPSVARLKRSKDTQVLIGAVPRVVVLAANSGSGSTAPVEVRRAISLAIQREGIAAAILRAPGTGATQMFADNVAAWHDPRISPLTYDPQASRALLKAQGWVLGADGILEKDGRPLRLKLITYSDRPELPLIATALQAQLREVGVDVEVSIENASAIPAAHNDGTLQLALYGRNYALVPDPLVTLMADFKNGGAEWGPLGWSNPDFDPLISELLASNDSTEQQELRNKIVGLIQNDLPLIPVTWYRQSIAVSNSVRGAAIDPFERTFGLSTMKWAE
ncbi:ABC transporter substrate-binding protein [Pseudomonas syringae group genomosp. 3]|uniref:Extracellular solute-binding protein family 5 n=1 Tax=Pseudomonas syringae pv. primulae TaxID=251707 RepID=A0A3M3XGH2_9PSED|nr:ABC transporter substrate-binding protein [Pseudomonas syringae group genomosp. 3]RMO68494.1 Extracellular solute-binding protein family 5 [Pseudomonas syringae pv. primulae]RMR10198.1 Extracellular solute-binding protein family 5 [Pseudomonas syringae pv. primulae]RMU30514.1 Extracellular solute-binding protein family 5 [Pseudomonas syringae pv. primulae]